MNFIVKTFLYTLFFALFAGKLDIHATQQSLLHLTFHKGCAREIEYITQHFGIKLTTMFIQSLAEYEFDPASHGNVLYNITHDRAERIWQTHKEYFDQFDLVLVSDTTPLARIFLQNNWEKPLIIWICNRFDYADAASLDGEFPDVEYYQLLRDAIKKKSVHIVAYTPFEHYYARDKGVYLGTEVIKPCAPVSITTPHEKEDIFLIPPYHNDTLFLNLKAICDSYNIPCYNGRYNGPAELTR